MARGSGLLLTRRRAMHVLVACDRTGELGVVREVVAPRPLGTGPFARGGQSGRR